MSAHRTPADERRRRSFHFFAAGAKLTVIGLVFLFALDRNKPLAVAVGIVAEASAVACFVRAYRLRHPVPPQAAESYAVLQASMERLRDSELPPHERVLPRAPLEPR